MAVRGAFNPQGYAVVTEYSSSHDSLSRDFVPAREEGKQTVI
jgi:hypothetical protein